MKKAITFFSLLILSGTGVNAGSYYKDVKWIRSDCSGLIVDERERYLECEDKFALEECNNSTSIYTKDYPIEGAKMASARLKYLVKNDDLPGLCMDSKVQLWCYAGSCQLVPDSGDFGFYPGKVNRLKVGSKVWTWIGDHPDSIEHEMWKEAIDGVVVAGELVHWPYESLVTFSQKVFIPAGLKEKVYRRSLEKP